jgi:hypothetical protein
MDNDVRRSHIDRQFPNDSTPFSASRTHREDSWNIGNSDVLVLRFLCSA